MPRGVSLRELQILDEPRVGSGLILVGYAQQKRWMHRHENIRRMGAGSVHRLDDVSAILLDRSRLAEDGTRSGRTQRNDQLRFDHLELALQPVTACGDLHFIRFLVNTALAARLELEMLDCVRYVSQLAVDAGFDERSIEHLAGRPDKRFAGQVLLVSGLFADEYDPRLL